MDANIQERVLILSSHILDSNDTIRATADKFGGSKSTVHIDVSKRLKKIDKKMHEKKKKILENNFNEKHIRGGEATKNKYLLKRPNAPELERDK